MSQVRQENEEYQSGQIACYAEYGLTPVRDMAGGVGFVNLPQDAATQTLLDKASDDCNARVPLPVDRQNKTLDDAAYQRMLDLRQCIVAYGYTIPDPPSAQTWEDSSPWTDAWNPYSAFNGSGGTIQISDSDLMALSNACPQPGPNYIVRVMAGD